MTHAGDRRPSTLTCGTAASSPAATTPIGLAGACPSGSEKQFVDWNAELAAPCGCDSGEPLGECWAIG